LKSIKDQAGASLPKALPNRQSFDETAPYRSPAGSHWHFLNILLIFGGLSIIQVTENCFVLFASFEL
jgi:hypothetical protein